MAREATFTATEADYVAANQLMQAQSGQLRLLWWIGIAAVILAAADIAFRMSVGDLLSRAIADASAIIFFSIIILGIRLMMRRQLPRQVRKMMQQNIALSDPVRCWWTDEAICFAGSNGTANLLWARLHRRLRNDVIFVFLQTDRLMYIVSKRALTTDQAIDLDTVAELKLGKQDVHR